MALHNEILAGRFNRLFQKLLSMKGGPPAPQLSSELQMQIGLFHGVENRFIESWNRFSAANVLNASVGNNSQQRIRNPATSTVIAVIERLSFAVSVADQVQITQDTNNLDLAATVVSRCLDNRPVRGSTSTLGAVCRVSAANATAASGGFLGVIPIPASTDYSFIGLDDVQIPLLPGDTLEVTTTALNNALTVNWMWRERILEESERF